MPTPIPIIAVTCGAKEGTSVNRASSVTIASPMPMPNSAVMIGSPIARTDPNAINKMSTAARMPIASLAGCVWSVNIEPPSSTWRLDVFAFFTRSRMCEARATGTSLACTSNWISAYAILPSFEKNPAPPGS